MATTGLLLMFNTTFSFSGGMDSLKAAVSDNG